MKELKHKGYMIPEQISKNLKKQVLKITNQNVIHERNNLENYNHFIYIYVFDIEIIKQIFKNSFLKGNYVGQTIEDENFKIIDKDTTKTYRKNYKHGKIQKALQSNCNFKKFQYITNLNQYEANAAEILTIIYFNSKDNGLNTDIGGISGGHIFYKDKVHPYTGKMVYKIDTIDGTIIDTYPTRAECLRNNKNLSPYNLDKSLKTKKPINGFIYQYKQNTCTKKVNNKEVLDNFPYKYENYKDTQKYFLYKESSEETKELIHTFLNINNLRKKLSEMQYEYLLENNYINVIINNSKCVIYSEFYFDIKNNIESEKNIKNNTIACIRKYQKPIFFKNKYYAKKYVKDNNLKIQGKDICELCKENHLKKILNIEDNENCFIFVEDYRRLGGINYEQFKQFTI